MHTISIVTVTLNRPSLADACKSVDNQTFQDWHHYVIGDGVAPTDYTHPQRTTIGFTRPIGATEPSSSTPDGTPYPIQRWAIRHLALGEYFCFLDDDNIYRPEFLQKMHDALASNPDVGIALCAIENLRDDQPLDGYPERGRCDNGSFVVRSHIAKEIGFPRGRSDEDNIQDYKFIRTCAEKHGWIRVPEKLLIYGANPNLPAQRGRTKIVYSWSLPLRGEKLMRSGHYEEAIAAFRKAIEIDSQDAWTLWQLGTALLHSGRPSEAMQAWNQWFELLDREQQLPNDWIRYCYSLVGMLRGDSAAARQRLETAIQEATNRRTEAPYDTENALNLAQYLLVNGQVEAARDCYEYALQQHPSREDIEDAIFQHCLLQATGLEITGIETAIEQLQDFLKEKS